MLSKHEEQADRREVIENEKRLRSSSSDQGSTFLAHTHNDTGGRFSAISNPTVIGTEATPKYPQGPAWCADPSGIEPPLGVDINAMEPVGEPHELKASIASLDPSLPSAKATPSASDAPKSADASNRTTPLARHAGGLSRPIFRRA
jgi:hypothetical protein